MNRKRINTHVRKGDLVEVITGDHKGARGNVLAMVNRRDADRVRVLIEGVNLVKKAVRPSPDRPQGGFIEKEAAIHVSNVRLIERKESKPVERKK